MSAGGTSPLRASVAFVALLVGACASLHPEPLGPAAPPPPPTLESPRLTLRAGELQHPALRPVRIDLSDGLDPDEAAVLAVLLDPDLVAARSEHDVGKAQILDAGILPNPVFSVGVDHPYGSGSAGTSNLLDLSLAIDTKAFVSRGARRSAAEASLEQIDLGIAWQEWQVAEQARLLTVRLGWLRRRLALAREERDFEQKLADALEAASQTGDATLGQIGIERAAVDQVRTTVHDLEQSETNTESDLLALLGSPAEGKLDVTLPKTPGPPPSVAPGTLDACLAHRLDLQALRHGYTAEQERIRQAVLEQFPDITVGVHYQRNESALQFIGGFVSLELPLFNRNQGSLAIGRATRQRLRLEYDARVASTHADLVRLARLSALIRRQLPEVHASIAPLEQIESRERDAVTRGDLDRLSYQTVRTALLDQRLQEANLSQALAEAEVGLQTACGGPISVSSQAKRP